MLRTATTAAGGAKLAAYTPLRAMSAEQLTAFWEAVEGDTSLQEKLSASTDGEIDTPIEAAAVVAIAKDAGFTITAGDLLRAASTAILELNDEELEKVAGGTSLLGSALELNFRGRGWTSFRRPRSGLAPAPV